VNRLKSISNNRKWARQLVSNIFEAVKFQEQFESWLRSQPETIRPHIAAGLTNRLSLRLLPFMRRKGKLVSGEYSKAIKFVLWKNIITNSLRISGDSAYRSAAYGASIQLNPVNHTPMAFTVAGMAMSCAQTVF
jgi:hypothetical protein